MYCMCMCAGRLCHSNTVPVLGIIHSLFYGKCLLQPVILFHRYFTNIFTNVSVTCNTCSAELPVLLVTLTM